MGTQAQQLCLGQFLSTVKSQICRVWCQPRSEGLCWFFSAPLGPEARGLGCVKCCSAAEETKAGKCNHPTVRSDQSFLNQPYSTLPGAEKHLQATGCLRLCWGHCRGERMGGWGERAVGQRWGCLMSMSQPGGCLTQSSP